MSEQQLLLAMAQAYRQSSAMMPETAMRAVLDVLHAHGYRRCAEGQKVTQSCLLAEDANAAQRAAENDLSKYMARAAMAEAEVERLRAEADALRADAERYRWLRSSKCSLDESRLMAAIER